MTTAIAALTEAVERRRAADYPGALESARRAATLVSSAGGDPALPVDTLIALSRAEEDMGHHGLAGAAAGRAVEAAGGDPRLRARAVNRQAEAFLADGRSPEALPLAAEAVELTARAANERSADRAEALVTHGLACLDVGDFAQSAALLDQAAAATNDDAARARASMARIALLRFEGRYEEAFACLGEARAAAVAAFGERSLEVATVLNNLGVCCKFAGRFDEGEAAYQESLAILEAAVGPAHPDVATLYHNLGGLAHARRDFTAAEPWARRSVEVRIAALGPDHVFVADDEVALAGVLLDLDRGEEAEQLLRRALTTYERVHGPVHYEIGVILGTLGSAAQRRGALDDAAALHRRALSVKTEVLGDRHPELAITLNNLGVVTRRPGAQRRGRPALPGRHCDPGRHRRGRASDAGFSPPQPRPPRVASVTEMTQHGSLSRS
jgi:tetratricopeptide (TPR) repeat protein